MQDVLAHLDPPVEAREEVHNDAGLPHRRIPDYVARKACEEDRQSFRVATANRPDLAAALLFLWGEGVNHSKVVVIPRSRGERACIASRPILIEAVMKSPAPT